MRKYRTSYDAIGEAKAVYGVIEVSEAVAAAMGLGEPIDDAPPVKTAEEQQAEAIAVFLSGKADDVIAKLVTAPADKADLLKATREVEAGPKGKNRKTVLDAIDAQLKSFESKE